MCDLLEFALLLRHTSFSFPANTSVSFRCLLTRHPVAKWSYIVSYQRARRVMELNTVLSSATVTRPNLHFTLKYRSTFAISFAFLVLSASSSYLGLPSSRVSLVFPLRMLLRQFSCCGFRGASSSAVGPTTDSGAHVPCYRGVLSLFHNYSSPILRVRRGLSA